MPRKLTCAGSRNLTSCVTTERTVMSAAIEAKQIVKGGSFLIEEQTPESIFTPGDFNEEHRMIADTTRRFMDAEVLPRIPELENKDWKLARQLVKQAAELGLVGANISEEYGGVRLGQTRGANIPPDICRGAPFAPPPGGPTRHGPPPAASFRT